MKYATFIVKASLEDLRRNKVRTFLTALGILIGVLSVVLLLAFGLGLKQYIQGQFESLGTNLIVIMPGNIFGGGGGFRSGGSFGTIHFDEKDVVRLKRIEKAAYVAPAFTKTVTVSANGNTETSDLAATTSDFFAVRNFEIDQGQLFKPADDENSVKKAVIGATIAEKLYGSASAALGKTMRIENQGFTVIGVLKRKGGGGFGGPDLDVFSFIPYKSALSFNPDKKFMIIYIKADTEDDLPLVKFYATREMGKRYKEDEFSVVEQTEMLNMVTTIFSILNYILVAIGSISLVVGGVGIMNIMYASVLERTREIGIKRSVGATRRDILYQFLSEAVILSLMGSIMGLGLSYAIVLLIQPLFPATISLVSVAIALTVSSCIGIFFGVFPANKAARLSPIDAIRYE